MTTKTVDTEMAPSRVWSHGTWKAPRTQRRRERAERQWVRSYFLDYYAARYADDMRLFEVPAPPDRLIHLYWPL